MTTKEAVNRGMSALGNQADMLVQEAGDDPRLSPETRADFTRKAKLDREAIGELKLLLARAGWVNPSKA
jgi:hypothetical protein